jgi:hypothetical protein
VGCSYGDDHHHGWDDGMPTYPSGSIAQSTIDVDATLTDIQPGQEAGAFIEYRAGGTWRVFTSCDSALLDANGRQLPPCIWDIFVSPSRTPLRSVNADGLEPDDLVEVDQGSAHLVTVTDADFDGMLVEAEPGEPVQVDVWLDDGPAERYVYWVEAGGLNAGAPTNPIDLSPNGT